jgi:hypothetical protein
MSKKLFTNEEVELLSKNKYIKNITIKGITYTEEFKKIFITENINGKLPRQIFEDCGFDIDILGTHRIHSSGKRWRKSYKEGGIIGLSDTRKLNSGRPSTKKLSLEEKYARLEAKLKLLKAENELLKKLDMIERQALKKK